jgi:integrase
VPLQESAQVSRGALPVYLPIRGGSETRTGALPLPRNAPQDCPYYFWNGQTSRRAVVGIAERTLASVFKKSGVKNAHAHRFRHTLATRLLEQGATFEQVADVLGNSPAIVRKHYGNWSKGRQDNIDRLMFQHFGTPAELRESQICRTKKRGRKLYTSPHSLRL